jgi:hypothetical protein
VNEVAIKTLHHGQRFRCYSGHVWTYQRKDSKGWIVWAIRESDGLEDCFAESAKVTPLSKETTV